MKFTRIVPILRSFDEAKAKEFYVDFLGFNVDWQHRFEPNFPLYFQVSRAGLVMHLSEHHGDCIPGAAIRIEVDDVDEWCRLLRASNYRFAKPEVVDTPWNSRDMSLIDPFGNRLTFTSAIST